MFHAFKHCSRIRVNWSKSNAPTFLWIPWEFATLWQGQRPWNQWASWAPRKKNPTPCSLLDLGSQQLHQFHPRKASNLKKKMWVFPALVIANLHFSRNHFGTSGNFGRVSVTSASFQELLETNGEFLHSQPNKRRIPVDLLKKKLKD